MALRRSQLAVGDVYEAKLVDNLTRTQIVQYAGASGDYNPVHSDEVFATKVAGYPTVFAHGMLTMGLTGRMLTDQVGDGRLTYYGARFVGQVWPGDDLLATATVEALREDSGQHFADLAIVTRNQHGEEVLRANATARIDP